MAEAMRASVGALLKGIDRYNPENLSTLERYVTLQAKENTYDLEANLAVLKLYQFNPTYFQVQIASQVLLKALTNLPHTDFTLCKCLIDAARFEEDPILKQIIVLATLLETCQFDRFWDAANSDILMGVVGFEDSVRKYICHVVGITYQTIEVSQLRDLLGGISDDECSQWTAKYGWKVSSNTVFIANQDDNIKTKNITEKIQFEDVASIMSSSR